MSSKRKILVIRFSSFGDIIQSLHAVIELSKDKNSSIDFATKREYQDVVKYLVGSKLNKILSLDKKESVFSFSKNIFSNNYTHIYDTHNNIRSFILKLFFFFTSLFKLKRPPIFLTRSKNRFKRFLFFNFRINSLSIPFIARNSFLAPLANWQIKYTGNPEETPKDIPKNGSNKDKLATSNSQKNNFFDNQKFIAIAPSAAWTLKRWPKEHWQSFIDINPNINFAILGGPDDKFCENFNSKHPTQEIKNFAGKLSFIESFQVIKESLAFIVADTGLLHFSDFIGHPTIALLGPTAFGYPYHSNTTVLDLRLKCSPCSKHGNDKCKNKIYKQCLTDISPLTVRTALNNLIPNQVNIK